MNIFFQNDEGLVPDEQTAIKIAETIWLPLYGESINNKKPFIADYNSEEDCWEVHGTLPEKMRGGVPEIKISRSDCRILDVSHGR